VSERSESPQRGAQSDIVDAASLLGCDVCVASLFRCGASGLRRLADVVQRARRRPSLGLSLGL